jgi:2-amino-4-hydroxy-6-hydroxymethyldihydropteridine diphosphokinase
VHSAYLGIGGNLGDRAWHLAEAVRRLNAPPEIKIAKVSSIYESPAVGYAAQPDFLNAVVHVTTSLAPHALLARCLQIETALGRVRRERWGPRTIDIDVLQYDALVLDDPALMLPHPRMRDRSFVLTPLAEIAPELTIGGEPVPALAEKIASGGLQRIGPLLWANGETSAAI